MNSKFLTVCLILALALSQAFAMQPHNCDAMMSDSHSPQKMPQQQMHGEHAIHGDQTLQHNIDNPMDCCTECLCVGSTCSSLVLALSTVFNTNLVSQQKPSNYRFSVIASTLNSLLKPPILA